MKYFLDTEFLEGEQSRPNINKILYMIGIVFIIFAIGDYFYHSKPPLVIAINIFLGLMYFVLARVSFNTKPTIDLISIGIVSEDEREYYAISKDFDLREAWNRFQWKTDVEFHYMMHGNSQYSSEKKVKEYWIRENILMPIYNDHISGDQKNKYPFSYSTMKWLIKNIGKKNEEIANEIKSFCGNDGGLRENKSDVKGNYWHHEFPEFYAYYADYDWVVFCWLFGKMIDLPKGFPMFAFDIQQLIEDNNINKEELIKKIPQEGIHNSLQDAIWNKKAFNYIQTILNEKRADKKVS